MSTRQEQITQYKSSLLLLLNPYFSNNSSSVSIVKSGTRTSWQRLLFYLLKYVWSSVGEEILEKKLVLCCGCQQK